MTQSRNLGADLASAFDTVGLTASQRQVLISALSAPSADVTGPEAASRPPAPDNVPVSTLPSITNGATQGDIRVSDIANILDVISRAQMSAGDRRALVTSLNNLLVPGQATSADLTRGNTVTSPPPYA